MASSEDERLAKEIELLSDDLLGDLHKYLDQISIAGRIATSKRLDIFVDPQVRLAGTDGSPGHDIPISLCPRDALKLIEAAQLALSGEGEESFADASAAQWEITPDRFSLGEHWQIYVNTILNTVCKELAVRGDGTSAKLHNMLLYEKGAISKHHDARESIKVDEPQKDDEPVKVDKLDENDKPMDFGGLDNNDKRVKVYELQNKNRYDRGTGFCAGQLLTSGEGRIAVRSEDNAQPMLLDTEILHDCGYQKQEETLIVWTESSGLGMAMTFEQAEMCAQIWALIVSVQQRVVATYLTVYDGLSLADSTKIPGMFATLVISLPSVHWGGAVTVSHNGQEYSLETHSHDGRNGKLS